jgi:hypothetical protein
MPEQRAKGRAIPKLGDAAQPKGELLGLGRRGRGNCVHYRGNLKPSRLGPQAERMSMSSLIPLDTAAGPLWIKSFHLIFAGPKSIAATINVINLPRRGARMASSRG